MKKLISVVLVVLLLLTCTSCGRKETIALLEQDKETLTTEKGALEQEVTELKATITELEATSKEQGETIATLNGDKDTLSAEKGKLKNEVTTLKAAVADLESKVEEAATWFALSELEKEEQAALLAKKEEEKRIAAEKEAERQRKAKEAEEKRGYETGITYDNIARNPDDYKGEKVKFSGKVIQVIEGSSYTAIRFAIDRSYKKIVYCRYKNDIVESRILEDDRITIYGISKGLMSYEATSGATITIPEISIDKIDQ